MGQKSQENITTVLKLTRKRFYPGTFCLGLWKDEQFPEASVKNDQSSDHFLVLNHTVSDLLLNILTVRKSFMKERLNCTSSTNLKLFQMTSVLLFHNSLLFWVFSICLLSIFQWKSQLEGKRGGGQSFNSKINLEIRQLTQAHASNLRLWSFGHMIQRN